jgi:transposase
MNPTPDFKAQYHRLASRRRKKRAIGPVKHSLLVTVYFMLRDNRPYKDLGVETRDNKWSYHLWHDQ